MNLILFSPSDFFQGTPDQIRVTGKRFNHMRSVHQVKVGSVVKVGLINGLMGSGRVETLTEHEAVLSINLTTPPPAPLPVTLIIALPRPKMFRRVLSSVVSMGIKTIYIINSYRVEKSFWQTAFLEPDYLEGLYADGLSQGVDTVMPAVRLQKRFKPFVEDDLPDISRGSEKLIAHPGTDYPCPAHINRPVTLAIGPEGGFIPYEVEKFKDAGFSPVHIGSRILRVETAVPYLIGRISSV